MSALVITAAEAAARLRCGRTRVFELLESGELRRGKRLGRETVVTIASIEALERKRFGGPRHKPLPVRNGDVPPPDELRELLRASRLRQLAKWRAEDR